MSVAKRTLSDMDHTCAAPCYREWAVRVGHPTRESAYSWSPRISLSGADLRPSWRGRKWPRLLERRSGSGRSGLYCHGARPSRLGRPQPRRSCRSHCCECSSARSRRSCPSRSPRAILSPLVDRLLDQVAGLASAGRRGDQVLENLAVLPDLMAFEIEATRSRFDVDDPRVR